MGKLKYIEKLKKLWKLKYDDIFSNEKGSITNFFVALTVWSLIIFFIETIIDLIEKKPIHWGDGVLLYFITVTSAIVAYFIARFLAYRIKIFSKTKYPEVIHLGFFILLNFIFFVLFLFI